MAGKAKTQEALRYQAAVAARIRRTRTQLGITRAQLARATGIAEPSLMHYEAGRRMPSVFAVERLAKALGVSLRTLVPKDDTDCIFGMTKDALASCAAEKS